MAEFEPYSEVVCNLSQEQLENLRKDYSRPPVKIPYEKIKFEWPEPKKATV